MATYRRPKGTYTRPTPDFFGDTAATVGGFYWPTNPLSTTFDLFNNSTQGYRLHVYGLWVGNDAAGLYGVTYVHGFNGSLANNGFPVSASFGQPPGALYIGTQAAQYPGFTFPKDTIISDVLFLNNEAGSMDLFNPGGPIKIIDPGYSLRVYTSVGSGQTNGQVMAVSFYYFVLPDAN